MEEVEEIDTCCARKARPRGNGKKAVALNILIKVDKQRGNGERTTCNTTNKVKCKEKQQKSPCKKSKKKECCSTGYDTFMPPPAIPNCQMLPCGCVVVYDDPRNKANAEIQCSQRQPERCCKGNQYNACTSSASQTTIHQQGSEKEKRGCSNNACQTTSQSEKPPCTKGKRCGQCKTTGCQVTGQSSSTQISKQKKCGPTKCSSCQTCAPSPKPRLCDACSNNNHCNHCVRSQQQPTLCTSCASSGSIGSQRSPCHKTSSECQTHATCIPKTKEHMKRVESKDQMKRVESRDQMKRVESRDQMKRGESKNQMKRVESKDQMSRDRSKTQMSAQSYHRIEERIERRVRDEVKANTKESKVQTCPLVEIPEKMDRSVQSFYSTMVLGKPPVAPVEASPSMGTHKAQSYYTPQTNLQEVQPPPAVDDAPNNEEYVSQTENVNPYDAPPPAHVHMPEPQQLPPKADPSEPVNAIKSRRDSPQALPVAQANLVKSQQLPPKADSYQQVSMVRSEPTKGSSYQQVSTVNSPPKGNSYQQVSTVNSPPKGNSYQQVSTVNSPPKGNSYQQVSTVNSPPKGNSYQQVSTVNSPPKGNSYQQVSTVNSPLKGNSYQQVSTVNSPPKGNSYQQVSTVNSPPKGNSYQQVSTVNSPPKGNSYQQVSTINSPPKGNSYQQVNTVSSQSSKGGSHQQVNMVKSELPKGNSYQQVSMVTSQRLPPSVVPSEQVEVFESPQPPPTACPSEQGEMIPAEQLPPTAAPSGKVGVVKSERLSPQEQTNDSYIQEEEPSYAEEVEGEEEGELYNPPSPPALYENSQSEETPINDDEEGTCEEACDGDGNRESYEGTGESYEGNRESCEEGCESYEDEYEYGVDGCSFGYDNWAWNSWNKFVSLVNGEPIPNPCFECRSEDDTNAVNPTMECPDLEYGSMGSTVGGLLRTDMMSEDTCILLVALPLVVLSLMASFSRGC
ncbi:unnamed protein product [Orchesella dallaii]|uniref:Uncharacterized protein n=1 Tax=Orchesella dallaii TaxID=48710 RepID=A0ABP1QL75_9HEXA